MLNNSPKSVAIIVAHPDDETLWSGGTILSNPSWNCFVVCLSRKSDMERSEKFFKALKFLNVDGVIGDLDDGPDQTHLDEIIVQDAILKLMPQRHFDLVITHNPYGEYTRHIRHEEVSYAVINLWNQRKISTDELWTFAYEDGNKKYFPKPIEKANFFFPLTNEIWHKKYHIVTEIYGFKKNSFEADTTPRAESFWQFFIPIKAKNWLKQLEFEKM